MSSKFNNNTKRVRSRPKNSSNNITFRSAVPNQLYSSSFPREMKVTLNYSEYSTVSNSTGLAADVIYNLNSIFDPNRSGVGHQPQGYDQWATFYGRYRVDGCMFAVTHSNAPTAGGYLGILGNNDATSITDPSIIAESPLSQTAAIAVNGPAVKMVKYFDLATLTGVSRSVYNADDRYSAPFGSNPTEILVCHSSQYSAAAYTYDFHVDMKFFVTLFDPIQLQLS